MNRIQKILMFLSVIMPSALVVTFFPIDSQVTWINEHQFPSRILFNQTLSINKEQCTIILRDRSGRLGNRLFMFASAFGLSLSHSCSLDISKSIIQELTAVFDLDLIFIPSPSRSSWFLRKRRMYNHCSYLSPIFDNKSHRIVELLGFWQVHTYFSNHSSEIRRHLRFKTFILDRVHRFFNSSIHHNVSARVGVHIRRGDFLQDRRVSTDQYVFDAMSHFQKKYQSVVFIIATDDRKYCENVFGNRSNVIFTPSSFDGPTDLAVLSLCDHLIITVGTFGWWGGYLLHNRAGEIITDAKSDFSPLDANCQREDYFPSWFSFLNRTRL